MLLPESVLRTISYYESKPLHKTGIDYNDYITIYFKSLMKRRKRFKWQCLRVSKGGSTYIETTNEFTELKNQLDEYFNSIRKAEELRL